MNLKETKDWLKTFRHHHFMIEIADVLEFAIEAEALLRDISNNKVVYDFDTKANVMDALAFDKQITKILRKVT